MAFFPVFLLISDAAFSADSFYKGKTVRIIVGYPPGGGYDANARALSRHIGKHIPGNPNVIVENKPGAGGMISAKYLYKVAKPDGLSIGHFAGSGIFLSQIMGMPGIEFDARKYEFIGAPSVGGVVCYVTKASGITNIDQWMASKRPIKFGGVRIGSSIDTAGRALKAALGLPIKYISGYKGVNPIRLAVESGELDGTVASWYGLRVSWRKLIESGDVNVLLQAVPKPFPDLPGIPLAIDLAKTEEARQLIEAGAHSPAMIHFPFMLPPGTSKERVLVLRKAFHATMKDREFLAETEKAKMAVDPVSGEELKRVVDKLFQTDPALIAKLKEVAYK